MESSSNKYIARGMVVVTRETDTVKIARSVVKRFPSLSTAGTGAHELVRFILAKRSALSRSRLQKVGDDARDYINSAYFLRLLSKKALGEISQLKRGEMRQRLKAGAYPFSPLSKKDRESLLSLPSSWIYGSAQWRLDFIRHNET